jgi:hypothetical protein
MYHLVPSKTGWGLPMSKAPRKSKSQKPKPTPKRRDRGPHGLSVPEAGAMIGLGRNASYEAAKEGRIPVLRIGALKIVPRGTWLQMIGATDAA